MDSFSDDGGIKELYRSFVEAVERDGDLSSFSEDDLIDIFDYVTGIPDDFIAGESLRVGERLYPDSLDLLKRRAFLWHQVGRDDLCERLLDRLPSDLFLSDMRLSRNYLSSAEFRDAFGKTIDSYEPGSVEDGDIIYLVDYFDSFGELDIIERYADNFSRVSEYPSTIYNELFHLYWQKENYSKAAKYGRMVTELEPFNESAWTELADLNNIALMDHSEAVECADFALAINPGALEALVVKSSALYDSDPEASRRIVTRLNEIAPEDPLTLYAGGVLKLNDGMRQQGIDCLSRAIMGLSVVRSRDLYDILLRYIDGPLEKALEHRLQELFEADNSIDAVKWCRELLDKGSVHGAHAVFEASNEVDRYDFAGNNAIDIAVEAMYRTQRYDGIIAFLEIGYMVDDSMHRLPVSLALVYALAMYRGRLKPTEDIVRFAVEMLAYHALKKDSGLFSERLVGQAAAARLEMFASMLAEGEDRVDLTRVDPFM